MTPSGDRFLSEKSAELVDGRETLLAVARFELSAPTTLTVKRLHSSADRPQGLVLEGSGPLRVVDLEIDRVVLWSDTAPALTEVSAPVGPLNVWNVWRDAGVEQAWVGWAAIRLEESSDGEHTVRLNCSDGYEPGDSADLEIELIFDPPLTQGDAP